MSRTTRNLIQISALIVLVGLPLFLFGWVGALLGFVTFIAGSIIWSVMLMKKNNMFTAPTDTDTTEQSAPVNPATINQTDLSPSERARAIRQPRDRKTKS